MTSMLLPLSTAPARQRPLRAASERSAAAGPERAGRALQDMTVLVIEDDILVGVELVHILRDLGAEVVGPFRTRSGAEGAVLSRRYDAALLDVNLEGQYSFELARDLRARNVPVLFVTAHAHDDIFPEDIQDIPRLAKPVQAGSLVRALKKVL